jgi:hypothetical protein
MTGREGRFVPSFGAKSRNAVAKRLGDFRGVPQLRSASLRMTVFGNAQRS